MCGRDMVSCGENSWVSGFCGILGRLQGSGSLARARLTSGLNLTFDAVDVCRHNRHRPSFRALRTVTSFFGMAVSCLRKGRPLGVRGSCGAMFACGGVVPVPGVGEVPLLNAVTYNRPVVYRRGFSNSISVPSSVGTSFTLHYGNSSVISTHVGSNSVICVEDRPVIRGNRVTTIHVRGRTALGEIF